MSETSVYELLSTLCQKLRDDSARKSGSFTSFRGCRARAFEILLKSSGSPSNLPDPQRQLDIHLFEMQLKATTAFQRSWNERMRKTIEEIEENPYFRTEIGKAILTFLLHLKAENPPDTYKYHQATYPFGLFSALQPAYETNPYITFTEEMFKLPSLPFLAINRDSHEVNPYLESFNRKMGDNFFTQNLLLAQEAFRMPFDEIIKPKFPEITPETAQEEEIVVNGEPLRDLSGLSLPSSAKEDRILSQEDFLQDLRALCMGFKSRSFTYHQGRHEFRPGKRLRVENLTGNTLRQVIWPFLAVGTCLKRLQLLIASNPITNHRIYEGFIFRAFCLGVDEYLACVRLFIAEGKDKSILSFSYRLSGIADQVTTLGRICHVNPGVEQPEVFPSGAKLLKYLSVELNTARRDIFLLLANLLVKCVEFYVRHLEKWIFHGVLEDPHGELFIMFLDQYNYDTKRFFDKAYSAQQDLIPDFLTGFDEDIILCGKYTMLLKAFNPLHPLLDVPKPNFRICLSDTQISALKREVTAYSDTASATCGPRITIEEINRRKSEKLESLKHLVEQERLESLRQWEIQREEAESEAIKIKQQHLQELKRQMEAVRVEKEARRREEVAQELIFLEQQRLAEEEDLKRDCEERMRRIQHYQELNELAEKKLERAIKAKKDTESEVSNDNYKQGMKKSNSDILNANEISELARNRTKVLGSTEFSNYEGCDNRKLNVNLPEDQLTPCQRNKLKVMSHEFNIDIPMDRKLTRAIEEETMTELERNRRRILYRDLNSNEEIQSKSLSLNFETERMRNRRKILETEFDISIPSKEKLTPMSTTSDASGSSGSAEKFLTPDEEELKEIPIEEILTLELEEPDALPEAVKVEEVVIQVDNFWDDILKFKTSAFTSSQEPKNSPADLSQLNAVSLKEFLRLSIAIPLECHMSLLNGEIMKMFLQDLDILGHWQSLRHYFLLMDGEFGSHICDGLIERLERGIRPAELLNFHTLHAILDTSLSFSAAGSDKNSDRLSFTVNAIPEKFIHLSPNVLEDLQLSYRVEWPVNLILSPETIQQYNTIFHFLLKVRRMGWLLESVFQHLKDLSRAHPTVKSSGQFRHIHVMRHKLNHFVLTLQNHITVNALQASWEQLMQELKDANSMMDLYKRHMSYIKRIRFLCMLNRHSKQFFSAIEDVFKLIIRFSCILKAKAWKTSPEGLIHPKYEKLIAIEELFDKLMQHIIQMGWKIVSHGYQREIGEFVFLLNSGGYYVAEGEFK